VGRETPGRRSCPASQSQVGEAFPQAPGVGWVLADGTDEGGARAAPMDEWVAEERVVPGVPI